MVVSQNGVCSDQPGRVLPEPGRVHPPAAVHPAGGERVVAPGLLEPAGAVAEPVGVEPEPRDKEQGRPISNGRDTTSSRRV